MATTKEVTRKELVEKVKSLNLATAERNAVVCAMIGHSSIISMCFGYVHCGRCGEQIGDRLGGVFDTTNSVLIGHNCETCQENYKKLTWEDKLYSKNPFKIEAEVQS